MSSRFLQCGSEVPYKDAFPWFRAIVISTVLFWAENYFPIDVMVTENSRDLQARVLQGSVIRQIGYPIIGMIGIVWLVRGRGYRLAWRSPLVLAFGSLLAWSILSLTWAQEPATSLKRILAYLLMSTCAAGAAVLWSRTEILKFISLNGATQLTVGVVGEIVIGHFTPWSSDYRFAGTLTWNVQGFCCLLLVLSSLAASDADLRFRMAFRCIALYGFTFLVLTKSRSSMLGVLTGLLVYYLLTRSLRAKVWVAAAVSFSCLLLYMSGAMSLLIDFLSRHGEGTDTLAGRVPMWELARKFVERRPITGYGFQDFWTIPNMDYFSSEFHWTIAAAHNGYLETLLTLGLVGMCLHVLALLFGLYRGIYLYKIHHSPIFALAAAICCVVLVVGTLETVVLWLTTPYSFGVIMLIWSLSFEKESSFAPARSPGRLARELRFGNGLQGRSPVFDLRFRETASGNEPVPVSLSRVDDPLK